MHVRARGFTLIELVVTVAIAALLAALAYPSFVSQMRKSRRVDAREALAQVQAAQEDWRGTNTTYAASVAALSLSATSPQGNYSLSVSGASATGYTATATAIGKQAGDTECATISVTLASGQTTYAPSNKCWGLP